MIRLDKFTTEKLPVPTKFEDLENPKFANRIAFPDVTNPQHWPVVTALSKDAGGDETTPEKGFEQAKSMKPLYYYSAATELVQKLTMGDVIAAPWHAGMAVRLHNAGQQVAFIHPQIGNKKGEVEYNFLGIIKGTKNVDAAAAFINAFLDTQVQVEFAKPVGIVPVNREARAVLAKDPVMSKYMMLDDKDIANAASMDWNKVNVEKWRSTWARTVSK
ncbi:hypothetical protein AWV80_26190 [Cupriavidus sp. UYMU48A]|nr:hypothetical protein AWV80_26190 [Cupriavidus sp. UYMU48A]